MMAGPFDGTGIKSEGTFFRNEPKVVKMTGPFQVFRAIRGLQDTIP
jgi:hypothetical protein